MSYIRVTLKFAQTFLKLEWEFIDLVRKFFRFVLISVLRILIYVIVFLHFLFIKLWLNFSNLFYFYYIFWFLSDIFFKSWPPEILSNLYVHITLLMYFFRVFDFFLSNSLSLSFVNPILLNIFVLICTIVLKKIYNLYKSYHYDY